MVEDLIEAVRLKVEPGETLLLRPKLREITAHQAKQLLDYVQLHLPGIEILVSPLPLDIALINQEGTDGSEPVRSVSSVPRS